MNMVLNSDYISLPKLIRLVSFRLCDLLMIVTHFSSHYDIYTFLSRPREGPQLKLG